MIKVLLVGNPNTGKTTLFNKLTGKKERTGNWNGVTSKVVSGKCVISGEEVIVYDLPGVYSLDGGTLEEKTASDFIKKNDFDLIVNMVEGRQIKRSLSLTKELSRSTDKLIIAITMKGEADSYGIQIDNKKLEKLTGIKCVFLDVFNRTSFKDFKNIIISKITNKTLNFETNYVFENCVFLDKKSEKKVKTKTLKSKANAFLCVALIVASIYISFGNYGIGTLIKNLIETSFSNRLMPRISDFMLRKNCSLFAVDFTQSIASSLVGVFAFFPQVAVLNLCITILEESGLLARLSFSLNGFLNCFGLNGRAVFPLMSGFGCTAIACGCASASENISVKKKLIFTLPMIPCSARTPVYLYLISFLTKRYCALVIIAMYLLNIMFALLFSFVYSLSRPSTEAEDLLIELPPMRKVVANKMLKSLINSFKQFIIKIGLTVFTVSLALYLLGHFDVRLNYTPSIDDSILYAVGGRLSFIFYPIGLNEAGLTIAVLSGLFAKEGIVSALLALYPAGLTLQPQQILSVLVFCAFYTPCFVALASIKEEIGLKNAIKSGVFQFVFALFLCYATYALVKSIIMSVIILLCVVALLFAIGKASKNNCCKGCKNEAICGKKTE